MRKTTLFTKKLLSVVLALAMLLAAVPVGAEAADAIKSAFVPAETLSFGAVSDIHYYPKALLCSF